MNRNYLPIAMLIGAILLLSAVLTFSHPEPPPETPTGLAIINTTSNALHVTWDSSTNVAFYSVLVNGSVHANVRPWDVPLWITPLVPDTEYCVQVAASKHTIMSDYTAPVCGRTDEQVIPRVEGQLPFWTGGINSVLNNRIFWVDGADRVHILLVGNDGRVRDYCVDTDTLTSLAPAGDSRRYPCPSEAGLSLWTSSWTVPQGGLWGYAWPGLNYAGVAMYSDLTVFDAKVLNGVPVAFRYVSYSVATGNKVYAITIGDALGGPLTEHQWQFPAGESTYIGLTRGAMAVHPVTGDLWCWVCNDSNHYLGLTVLDGNTYEPLFTEPDFLPKDGEFPPVSAIGTLGAVWALTNPDSEPDDTTQAGPAILYECIDPANCWGYSLEIKQTGGWFLGTDRAGNPLIGGVIGVDQVAYPGGSESGVWRWNRSTGAFDELWRTNHTVNAGIRGLLAHNDSIYIVWNPNHDTGTSSTNNVSVLTFIPDDGVPLVQAPRVPAVPRPPDLRALPGQDIEVTINPVLFTDQYEIWRGPFLIATTNATQIVEHDVPYPGVMWCYRIAAVSEAGTSALGDRNCVTNSVVEVPVPPTAPVLSIRTIGRKHMQLRWTASVSSVGIARYEVYRDGGIIAAVSGSTTSYTKKHAQSGVYQIRAVDNNGIAALSNTVVR